MHRTFGAAGLALLVALPVAAQQQLTLNDALSRARQSAPAIVAARLRIEEARARAVLPPNPTIELEAGTHYGIEVAQDLDLPQRRRARVDAVRAGVRQEEQRATEIERATLRDVVTTFLRALEADARAGVATGGKRLAEEALRIAERRYAAGDVAQLDVNLARTALARADAELRTDFAALTGHTATLQVLLGIPEPVTVEGMLFAQLPAFGNRGDLALLDAEIAEAEAEQRLARTLRWPDFGVRGAFRNEDGERIVTGGVGITLPVFNRGQEATAVANARVARLRAEREALTRTIEAEVRGAAVTYEALSAAADEYQRTVIPLVEENEQLALESYDAGQIGLGDLLLVRREALDARRALIDQLIATRLAEVELRIRTGAPK